MRREKAVTAHRVLYLDAGDVEESTNRLSSVTKGVAMHRLLSHTTCDAATVGNACWLRYGPGTIEEHVHAASYPLLLANFEPAYGAIPSVLLDEVGVFGLTSPFREMFTDTDFGWRPLDELEVARQCAVDLRARGAKLIVFLSHLGLDAPMERWDDRRIAAELQEDVDVIIGAHTHDLLPEGERVGRVLIAQAGDFGNHLGRVEIDGDSLSASVAPIPDDTPAAPEIAREAELIEQEVAVFLAETIGVADALLDAQWIAEALRRRMDADIGVCSEGLTRGVLPRGPITRGALWDVSETGANPGVTSMSGAQVLDMLERGNHVDFVTETPRPLRGRRRGRLHVAGPVAEAIDPARTYRVAATDWELNSYGGYAKQEWRLRVRYDFPTIVREAIEEELRR